MSPSAAWKTFAATTVLALATAYFAPPLIASPEPAKPAAAGAKLASAGELPAPETGRAGKSAARPVVRSVLAVSIDGLNPEAIRRLGPVGTPNLHKLMAKSVSTLNARTEYEATQTLPNHTGMVTGRAVDTAIGGHGVRFNEDNGSTVHQSAGERVKSVFTVVHKDLGRTAMFASKEKFNFLDRSWPQPIDKYRMIGDNLVLTRAVIRDLERKRRTFRLVHYSAPDAVGHASGYLSADYLAAVRRTDRRLGRLVKTIKEIPRLRRHLVLIVTSDHGGRGLSHAEESAAVNYTVPFLVWGRGIDQADLYALNPAYADPGTSRPDYSGRQPIRNGMVANLATQLLGLRSVPGSLFNRSQSLRIYSD